MRRRTSSTATLRLKLDASDPRFDRLATEIGRLSDLAEVLRLRMEHIEEEVRKLRLKPRRPAPAPPAPETAS